jgi:diaminopimelate epimerase
MSHPDLVSRALHDLPFAKMTGSGNDFVFFDGRHVDRALLTRPEVIQAICNRYNGIGADGLVVLEALDTLDRGEQVRTHTGAAPRASARIHYFNSDGSPADLCGNATLCATTLAVDLGLAPPESITLDTPAGVISSRVVGASPEIDLQAVTDVDDRVAIAADPGEARIGFAKAGIPHVVVLSDEVERIPLKARGPVLRHHPALGPSGANVNWVSKLADGRWRYRTFERGVEGETLACGTGAVATAVLLVTWGLASSPVRLVTSSTREVEVALQKSPSGWRPTLRGEGRIVFRGRIGDLGV